MHTNDEVKQAEIELIIHDEQAQSIDNCSDYSSSDNEANEFKQLMKQTVLHDKVYDTSKRNESTTPMHKNAVHFKIEQLSSIEDFLQDSDEEHNIKSKATQVFMCLWFKKYITPIIFILISTIYIVLSCTFSAESPDIWVVRVEFILLNITVLVLFILTYKLISFSLLVCAADSTKCKCCHTAKDNSKSMVNMNKIIFYTKHSEKYLSLAIVLIFVYILMFHTHNNIHSRYHDIFDFTESATVMQLIKDILWCLIILLLCLFMKIIFIRHLLLKYYLSPHLVKLVDMRRYGIWLKILLKTDQIFSIEVNDFININDIYRSNNNQRRRKMGLPYNTQSFSLEIFQKYMQTLTDIDTKLTFLLWHYDMKTNQVRIISDNRLNKLCERFAQYIIFNVKQNKLASTVMDQPSIALYKASVNSKTSTKEKLEFDERNKQYIEEAEFFECFENAKNALTAWKTMNMIHIKDNKLTLTELQRWLTTYFHDLIYLKQTVNSYEDILVNLDICTNFMIIFFLLFLYLLIFNDSFEQTLTMYAAMIAVCAIFGGHLLKQFLESMYFIFILNPYSIGDVILIEKVRYTVRHINIMSTELITAHTNAHYVVMKRNSNLLAKDITNITKSEAPYHNICFYVSQTTSMQKIKELRKRIRKFIVTEMWEDINDFWFVLNGVDEQCRMKITLHIGSNYSFCDAQIMLKQYHTINMHIRYVINQMGIHYKRFSNQDIQQSVLYEDDMSQKSNKHC